MGLLRASLLRASLLPALVVGLVPGTACDRPGSEVILASTTSTHDSGLFDVLIPAFRSAHDSVRVKVIAVGTGEALALGRRRDVDVLLVHSPADEDAFMAAGHGIRRLPVMYNDYVIVGPPADPAGARGLRVAEALRIIVAADAPFLSRGDSSGTHLRELELWSASGLPAGAISGARVEVGQGMGETLTIASERSAYTLTDRSTYLALRGAIDLAITVEGDAGLINPYSVITVRGARNAAGADLFAHWLTGAGGAAVIRAFGIDTHGEPLFLPGAPPGGD
ncbi:extracellular solute-binding protein [soil metagenome]